MNKKDQLRKKAELLEELHKYQLKEHATPFVQLEEAQTKTRSVTAYLDRGTVKCKVSLPSCYINKKVKVIVTE